MHYDSVQSMEYTITTPLFSAIILASISPTVPTGMVQWLFGCLLTSHLLCIPILYLSYLSQTYKNSQHIQIHSGGMNLAIVLLLVACVALQAMAFSIKLLYITYSWEYYNVSSGLQSVVVFLLVMQIFFVVTVLLVSTSRMILEKSPEYLADYSSAMYMVINLMIKFVIGIMLSSSALNDGFPVSSCNVWGGRYASPDPVPIVT